jgi:hypothetical protein
VVQVGVVLGLMTGTQIARAEFEPRVSGQPGEEHLKTHYGISIQGGGGVTNFTKSREQEVTGLGGSWEVRAVLNTRLVPALEIAYVGSARGVNGGLFDGAGLVGNGVEWTFRLNAPFLRRGVLLEPFAFVGLGWDHYSLTNSPVQPGPLLKQTSNVGVVPAGAGMAIGYKGLMAEARFTYRPAFDDGDLPIRFVSDRASDLDSWKLGFMAGYEF